MNKLYKNKIIIILFSLFWQVSLHAKNITFMPREQAWMQAHKTVKIGIDTGYASSVVQSKLGIAVTVRI